MLLEIGKKIGSYIIDSYEQNKYISAHCEICNKSHLFENLNDSELLKIFWIMSCYEDEKEKEFDIYEGQVIGTCRIENIKVIDEENKIYNITAKCFRCNETYTISNCSNDKFLIGELLSCSCKKGDTAILPQGEASFINRQRHDVSYYIYKDNTLDEIKYNNLLEETNKLVKEFEEQIENGEIDPDIPIVPTPPTGDDDEKEDIEPDTPNEPDIPDEPDNPNEPTPPDNNEDEDEDEYYTITVKNSRYGTIEVDKTKARPGKEVTITVIPNEGYMTRRVIAEDEDGDEILVLVEGNGKFSFKMPAMDVSVKVRYATPNDEEVE